MILLAFGWKKEIALLQADLEDDDNHDNDDENNHKITDDEYDDDYDDDDDDDDDDEEDDDDDDDDEYLTDVALFDQEDSGWGNLVGGTSGSQSKDLTSIFYFCFCRI